MDVTLSEEQERAAQVLADAGLVKSKEEAVTLGLEWMQEQARKLEALRADVAEGIASGDRGELYELEAVIAELRREHEDDTTPAK